MQSRQPSLPVFPRTTKEHGCSLAHSDCGALAEIRARFTFTSRGPKVDVGKHRLQLQLIQPFYVSPPVKFAQGNWRTINRRWFPDLSGLFSWLSDRFTVTPRSTDGLKRMASPVGTAIDLPEGFHIPVGCFESNACPRSVVAHACLNESQHVHPLPRQHPRADETREERLNEAVIAELETPGSRVQETNTRQGPFTVREHYRLERRGRAKNHRSDLSTRRALCAVASGGFPTSLETTANHRRRHLSDCVRHPVVCSRWSDALYRICQGRPCGPTSAATKRSTG